MVLAGLAVHLLLLPGCSPTYWFLMPASARTEIARSESELASLLEEGGFTDLGATDRATGDIGCGRRSTQRRTFGRDWRKPGLIARYESVLVHSFVCEGRWQVVIISSRGAESDAEQLRDTLLSEFAEPIETGAMRVESRCRIALE